MAVRLESPFPDFSPSEAGLPESSHSYRLTRDKLVRIARPPVWAVLLHGSFHDASCFEGVERLLNSLGVNTLAVDLPALTPFSNFNSQAKRVVSAMEKREVQRAVVVGASRGGDTALRVPGLAGPMIVEEVQLLAAALHPKTVQSFPENVRARGRGIQRNTEAFLNGIRQGPFGIAQFDRAAAPEVFYNHCSPEIQDIYSARLRPQRRSAHEPALTRWPDVPVVYARGVYDNVETREWALYRAEDMIGTELIETEADHSQQLSQPLVTANMIVDGIVRATRR